MKFLQNVPTGERLLRLLIGAAMLAGSLIGMAPGLLSYGLAATGLVLAITSFIGFCPMCAMAGRKPVSTSR